MSDIIIYTTPEVLEHKRGLKKGEKKFKMFYWKFSKLPKKFEVGERIYFATEGFIKGYFIAQDINENANYYAETPENSVEWRCDSWKDIKPIPCKSFQGFKYADKVPELNSEVRNLYEN